MMGKLRLKGEEDLLTLQVIGDGPMGGMTVTAWQQGPCEDSNLNLGNHL